MNKKILFFLLPVICVLPIAVLAAPPTNPLSDILSRVQIVIASSATVIIVISFILVGVLFLFAIGNPERFSVAKKALFWVIAGTVVCLLALTATTIIKNTLGLP